jgi:hypothetical protein
MSATQWEALFLGLCLGIFGCGGRVKLDPAGTEPEAEPAGTEPEGEPAEAKPEETEPEDQPEETEPEDQPEETEPEDQPEETEPEGDGTETCSTPPPALRPELVWRRDVPLYGLMGQGTIAYSPDGTRLITPADQYVLDGYAVYGAADGELLESAQLALLGRDRSWTRELRGDWQTFQLAGIGVVALPSGAPLLALTGAPESALLSGDGRYVASLHCAEPRIERHATEHGEMV